MSCYCGVDVNPGRKYCSRACSVSANNRTPKRKRNKKCRTCNDLILSELTFCGECIRKHLHVSTRKKREKRIGGYEAVKRRRLKLKMQAVEYKGGKCLRCGYDKCLRALGFHHRNRSDKTFGFGVKSNIAWEAIRIELEKCDLLCANCHMEVEEELASGGSSSGRAQS